MKYDQTKIDAARSLSKTLAEAAAETEQARQVLPAIRDKIIAAGLTRLLQPSKYGGGGATVRCFIDACVELAKGCVSTGWCNFVWGGHNFLLGDFDDQCQQRIWGDDPTILTSASIDPVGTACRVENGFELTGHWRFASGCDHADWLLLGATLDEGDGPEPWLFAIPKANCEIVDTWHVTGLRGTGSKDVKASGSKTFADCAMPFSQTVAPHGALAVLIIVAPVLGGAEAAVTRFEERLATRVTALQRKQKDQSIALLRLAEASTDVRTARLMVEAAADDIDRAHANGDVPDGPTTLRIMRDTAWAAQACRRAVGSVFSVSGGSALQDSEPLQRFWRDVNAGSNHARLNWEDLAEIWASNRIASSNL
jgi:3-hydroxy-9,10-secoandrosta-1,3,5(10)-triene-9,17-dione monooxygenase